MEYIEKRGDAAAIGGCEHQQYQREGRVPRELETDTAEGILCRLTAQMRRRQMGVSAANKTATTAWGSGQREGGSDGGIECGSRRMWRATERNAGHRSQNGLRDGGDSVRRHQPEVSSPVEERVRVYNTVHSAHI